MFDLGSEDEPDASSTNSNTDQKHDDGQDVVHDFAPEEGIEMSTSSLGDSLPPCKEVGDCRGGIRQALGGDFIDR